MNQEVPGRGGSRRLAILWLAIMMIAGPDPSQAGVLGGIGLQWTAHSFQPLHEEDTPNYYGVGVQTTFGWSLMKVFDFNFYAKYNPVTYEQTKMATEDARVYHYGLDMAVRVVRSIYIGIRGGPIHYRLFRQVVDQEVPGKWSGVGGEISIGGLIPLTRKSYTQVTLDVGSSTLTDDTGSSTGDKRQLDWVGLSVSFSYIGLDSVSFNSTGLRDWLNF